MNLIKRIKTRAFWRFVSGYGYNYSERKMIWESKTCNWNWLSISWGIRNSEKPQYFPIWNHSNNSSRSLIFGFGFWYFQFNYHRKNSFNQKRNYPFKDKFRKFWQLVG